MGLIMLVILSRFVDWQSFWECSQKLDLECSGNIFGYDVRIKTILGTIVLAAFVTAIATRFALLQKVKEQKSKIGLLATRIPTMIPWDEPEDIRVSA